MNIVLVVFCEAIKRVIFDLAKILVVGAVPVLKRDQEVIIRYVKKRSVWHIKWLINILQLDENKKLVILGRLAEADEIFRDSSRDNDSYLYLYDVFSSVWFTYEEVARYKKIRLYKLIYKVAFHKIE